MCYGRHVNAAVDASTLISLAWSGSLWLIGISPIGLHIPAPVRDEVVVTGLSRGHADAAAIEASIKDLPVIDVESPVDAAVLEAGRRAGAIVCNDIALGRRAANLQVMWLRTADLVVVTVKANAISAHQGQGVVEALHGAGRITDELLADYMEELS